MRRQRRKRPAHQATCKACGRPEKFDFVVPNSIWRAVVPKKLSTRAVCLYCFDEFAREAAVDYARFVNAVYFAGRRGAFVFTVQSAVDLPD